MMDYTHANTFKNRKEGLRTKNHARQNKIKISNSGVTFDLSLYWHQYPWTLGEVVCRLRAWISEM